MLAVVIAGLYFSLCAHLVLIHSASLYHAEQAYQSSLSRYANRSPFPPGTTLSPTWKGRTMVPPGAPPSKHAIAQHRSVTLRSCDVSCPSSRACSSPLHSWVCWLHSAAPSTRYFDELSPHTRVRPSEPCDSHSNLAASRGQKTRFSVFPSEAKSKVSIQILAANCERLPISPKMARARNSPGWSREGCVDLAMIRLPQTAATNPEQSLVRPPCGDRSILRQVLWRSPPFRNRATGTAAGASIAGVLPVDWGGSSGTSKQWLGRWVSVRRWFLTPGPRESDRPRDPDADGTGGGLLRSPRRALRAGRICRDCTNGRQCPVGLVVSAILRSGDDMFHFEGKIENHLGSPAILTMMARSPGDQGITGIHEPRP